MFKQTYNLLNHENYHKCYNKLTYTMFIRYLFKNLRIYNTLFRLLIQLNQEIQILRIFRFNHYFNYFFLYYNYKFHYRVIFYYNRNELFIYNHLQIH